MKKIIITIIIFLSSLQIVYSQSGWVWQNPMPSATALSRAFFLNANTAWVPSSYGRISKTTNGGLNWIDQSWQNNNSIYNVFFINEFTGWAVGSSGLVIKSTNGGTNWIRQASEVISGGSLYCVKFINSQTGWIGGGGQAFLRTTNGGINWILNNQIGDAIYALSFVNSQTGWLSCNNGHIRKTTNGGVTFQTKNVPSYYNCDIYFINENTGWFAGTGTNPNGGDGIYKTTDSGNNWIAYVVPTSECCYTSLHFNDINTGWVSTVTGRIYKTTNGGINWSNPIYPGGGLILSFIYFSDLNTGFVGGGIDPYSPGALMTKTTNGGLNWTNLVTNQPILYSISAVSTNSVFLSGNNYIVNTTNGGNEWIFRSNNYGFLNTIFFINEHTGWVAGRNSGGTYALIYKTTNSGISWINQDSCCIYGNYYGLSFINTDVGWVSGKNVIKKTTNGGVSWQKLNNYDTLNTYYSIQFIDANTGWAVYEGYSQSGGILKSVNGGLNWSTQYTSTNGGVKTLQFVNQYTGFATGYFPGILKTTNGGNNWSLVNDSLEGINSIYFFNANKGWAIGGSNKGIITKTTDGGISWEYLADKTQSPLYSIKFADANTGWIIGSSGVILKTTNGGSVFVGKILYEIPKDFYLHQNYPNPFNPSTKIKFDLPKSTHAKLIIYDILGREVATLVNEKLGAGSYEVEWSAGSYPSGVYFYRLVTNNFMDIKKMILIK